MAEHYFDPKRFPGMEEEVRASCRFRARWRSSALPTTRASGRASPPPCRARRVARLLNQPKTRPVLQVEALNVDIDGAPLQYSMTRFAGDWVQLTVSDSDWTLARRAGRAGVALV